MAAHWDRLGKTSTGVSTAVSFSLSISIFFCFGIGRVLKNSEDGCAGHKFLVPGIAFWEDFGALGVLGLHFCFKWG